MKNFDVEYETNRIIDKIRDYYKKNNLKGAIIGISGGKDSGVAAALFTKALGKENVLGITMPCESKSEDKADAHLVSDHFGFEMINVDLTSTYHAFKKEVYKLGNFTDEDLKNSDINVKPRLRMLTLYYFAALYSSIKMGTYLVAGTGNKCEIYVGYYTKGGDGTSDINMLAHLTVDEVIAIGEYLGVPEKVLYKTPNDGLSGMSDEEKLGIKYSDIAAYMENPENVDENTREKIRKKHNANLHKLSTVTLGEK